MALSDFEAFLATPGQKTDAQVVAAMASSGVSDADVARLTNLSVAEVSSRINAVREQEFAQYLGTPNVTDEQVVAKANDLGITPSQIATLTNLPLADVQSRINQVVETQVLNALQTPGLTDAQIVAAINSIGATAQQVSNVTGVPVAEVESRIAAVAPPAVTAPSAINRPTFGTAGETQLYNFLQTPGLTDAQIAAEMRRLNVSPAKVASMTGVPLDQVTSRFTVGTPNVVNTQTNQADFTRFLQTPGLTDAQILAEMNRLGINPNQVSNITGVPTNQVENRVSNLLPFSNATQGFQQDFNNYQSIPIGAQYNPGAVGGAGSPYSQIMSQMAPVGNPYAMARSGLSMGGYDPNIYDPNLLNNFVRQRAAELAAAGMPAPLGFDGGGGDSGFGGGDSGDSGGVGGAGGPGSTSAADPSDFGGFNGGLITKVMGPNPPTPDDGTMFVQKGEYIVKKDSVNKYGKGLLDKINDGKIPAKKMKSLLG